MNFEQIESDDVFVVGMGTGLDVIFSIYHS